MSCQFKGISWDIFIILTLLPDFFILNLSRNSTAYFQIVILKLLVLESRYYFEDRNDL